MVKEPEVDKRTGEIVTASSMEAQRVHVAKWYAGVEDAELDEFLKERYGSDSALDVPRSEIWRVHKWLEVMALERPELVREREARRVENARLKAVESGVLA